MKAISRAELLQLIEHTGPSISLYLSGHQGEGGPGVKQDKIKFKNLLREAKSKFLAIDKFTDREAELFNPLYDLSNNDGFWNEQSAGLVIFCAPGFLQTYRVPIHFNGSDLAVAGESFHVKPLLPMLNYEGKFMILTLSRDIIRLFKVENHFSQEIPWPAKVPRSIDETVLSEHHSLFLPQDSGRKEQSPRKGQGGSGSYDPTFHGSQMEEKDDILRFFQIVDRGLHENIWHNLNMPLVLVGVDYLLPLYREASSYQHIVEGGINGNPELISQHDLHVRAWEIVSPIFRQEVELAKAKYGELSTKDLGSNELSAIVKAAYFGQVDTLFISTAHHAWGTFDAENNRVEVHDEPQPGDIDLFDFAAQQTLLKGGRVYAPDLSEMPDHAPIAATFRFKANSATA